MSVSSPNHNCYRHSLYQPREDDEEREESVLEVAWGKRVFWTLSDYPLNQYVLTVVPQFPNLYHGILLLWEAQFIACKPLSNPYMETCAAMEGSVGTCVFCSLVTKPQRSDASGCIRIKLGAIGLSGACSAAVCFLATIAH